MKKILSLMLGLALVIGTTVAFADDKPADSSNKRKEEGQEEDRRQHHHPPPRVNFGFSQSIFSPRLRLVYGLRTRRLYLYSNMRLILLLVIAVSLASPETPTLPPLRE